MAKTLMGVAEWRKRKQKESYDGRYNFRRLPVTKTRERVIVGIDPDTKGCGVAVYDVPEKEVRFYDEVEPSRILDFIDDCVLEYGREVLLFRLEVPTLKTIYGASTYLMRKMKTNKYSKKSQEMGAFMHIFNSARCNEIANQLIAAFKRKHINYELVASDDRINFSTGKEKSVTDEGFMDYMRRLFVAGKKGMYPTKVSANQVKAMFPSIDVAGSEDQRDAVMLMAPEVIFGLLQERLA